MPHEKSYKYARESRNGDCDGLGNFPLEKFLHDVTTVLKFRDIPD